MTLNGTGAFGLPLTPLTASHGGPVTYQVFRKTGPTPMFLEEKRGSLDFSSFGFFFSDLRQSCAHRSLSKIPSAGGSSPFFIPRRDFAGFSSYSLPISFFSFLIFGHGLILKTMMLSRISRVRRRIVRTRSGFPPGIGIRALGG